MRIAYGDNKIQEVNNVMVNSSLIFTNNLVFEIYNEQKTIEIYNSLLFNGYADLREYKYH